MPQWRFVILVMVMLLVGVVDLSAVGIGSRIVIRDNSVVTINGGSIDLSRAGFRVDQSSSLIIRDGILSLRDGVLFDVDNSSLFRTLGNTIIQGHDDWIHTPYNETIGITPGDIIRSINSTLDFSIGTEVRSSNADPQAMWYGIFIYGGTSTIGGSISGIGDFMIGSATANIRDATISNIGRLFVWGNSHLNMSHSTYRNNRSGILIDESTFQLESVHIHDNDGFGLGLHNIPGPRQPITNSVIRNNNGVGLFALNAGVNVFNSAIKDNGTNDQHDGVILNSSIRSWFFGDTVISNNAGAEVVSRCDFFPTFNSWFTPNGIGYPSVIDDAFLPNSRDRYLLMNMGPSTAILRNLQIDTSNRQRFFGNFNFSALSSFLPSAVSRLYDDANEYMLHNEYLRAYDTMLAITEQAPETLYAVRAVGILPYLRAAIDGDFASLFAYLEQINHDNLEAIKRETMALTRKFARDYFEAFYLYGEIANNPPNEFLGLLAELSQAYCFMKIVESGSRSLPAGSRRQPQDFKEFTQIKNEIFDKIRNLHSADEGDYEQIPEVLEFATHNFPNPFNPDTNIHFTLPSDADVRLEIFNVRGQRVRSLISEDLRAGHHSVVWNGTDEHGRTVGSGVYFYRIQAGEFSAIRRMLLLK